MFEKRVNLFGVLVDDISLLRAISLARVSILGGGRRVFFTPNLEMIEGARKSEEIRTLLNSAQVLLPDGVSLLLMSRLISEPMENRVAGIDFGEELIALSEKEEARVFLLGAKRGVAKKAAKKLLQRHKNLKICGIHNGYFSNEDEGEVISKIQNANPDVLIVCMGFPRQEKFVYKHQKDFESIKVIACLGGAFDIWSGRRARAPRIIQKAGLEWCWRLFTEPSRAKRFFSSLPALFYASWNEGTK